MSRKRSKGCLPSISILFVLLFLSILYHASCSIFVKNIYNFGLIENIGFYFDSPASYQIPVPNSYLSNLFFNGPESYHMTTGILANDVSVTLQQIASAMYSVNYILEYFNTTTMQSISQLVLVSGNNPKSAPPQVWTLPEPIYIFTEEGKQSSPLFNTTRRISKMACLISCLMLTSDGKVFVQEYSITSGMNSNWEERFILTNYINPNNLLPYENVKIVDIEVVGYVNCETFFGVTNYGHVFSYGCNQNEIRGVTGASANHYDTTMMDSLSNIVSISGSKGAYDSEMSSIGAIDNNGNLFTWGFNGNGALGLNETSVVNSAIPTMVSLLPSTVKKICFGLSYALVILENDELYVFGDNRNQQCDPNVADSAIWVPRKMSNFNSAVSDCYAMRKLSTGISDGNLYSWGDSSSENYGHYPYGQNFDKIDLNIGETATKVALSNSNGIAVTSQGYAYVWGNNPQGILSQGEDRQIRYPIPLLIPLLNTSRASVVSVGFGSDCSVLILKSEDGDVTVDHWGTCTGTFQTTFAPEPTYSFVSANFSLPDVIDMEIGIKSAFTLLSNGDVYGW